MPTLAELFGFSLPPYKSAAGESDWMSAAPIGETQSYSAASNRQPIADYTPALPQDFRSAGTAFGLDSFPPVPVDVRPYGQSTEPGLPSVSQRSTGGLLGPLMAQTAATSSPVGGILQNILGDSAPDRGRTMTRLTWPTNEQNVALFGGVTTPIVDQTINGLPLGLLPATPYPHFVAPAPIGSSIGEDVADHVLWQRELPAVRDSFRTADGFGGVEAPQLASSFSRLLSNQSNTASIERDVSPEQNSHPQIYARIHLPTSVAWHGAGTDDGQFRSWDLDQDNDWAAYLRHAQYILPSAITNDPRIDRVTKFLIDTLAESAREIGFDLPFGMRPTVFGTRVHTDFASRVRALDLPGIGQNGVEQSWSFDEPVQNWSFEAFTRYGLKGSIRTDVYLRDSYSRKPLAIYDVKTGYAQLTPRRRQELRAAVGAGDIPVIELRYGDLTALQR